MNNIRMKPRSFIASPEMDNVVDEAVKRAAKELSDEIDFTIMLDMYKQMGWTEVKFEPRVTFVKSKMIEEWLRDNCKGHRISRGSRFLFENEKEASWFMLRWADSFV